MYRFPNDPHAPLTQLTLQSVTIDDIPRACELELVRGSMIVGLRSYRGGDFRGTNARAGSHRLCQLGVRWNRRRFQLDGVRVFCLLQRLTTARAKVWLHAGVFNRRLALRTNDNQSSIPKVGTGRMGSICGKRFGWRKQSPTVPRLASSRQPFVRVSPVERLARYATACPIRLGFLPSMVAPCDACSSSLVQR